jgi:hypothetical protein
MGLNIAYHIVLCRFSKLRKTPLLTEQQKIKIRYKVHLAFACIFLIVYLGFKPFYDKALIDKLFTIAGYTYGPLLGFYSFGLFTKRSINDKWVPILQYFRLLSVIF